MTAKKKTTKKTTVKKKAAKKILAVRETSIAEAGPRFCYYVDETSFIPGYGYRASVVFEDEPGYRPTGDWPYDVTKRLPYFWGDNGEHGRKRKWTLEAAQEQARRVNERNLGLSEDDVMRIIASSMRAGFAARTEAES